MIVLTGATGTVGRAVVAELKRRNAAFVVASRSPEKSAGLRTVHFDWDDFGSYEAAFAGGKKLLLLLPACERQLGYVLQATAAAKRAGVKHIVYLSVMGADQDPGVALGRQHYAAEREVRASGIAHTFLRPTYFMQNFVSYYGLDPKKGGDVYLPHGTGGAAWIDAQDIGEVAAAVLTEDAHAGKTYTLTGGDIVKTADVVAVFGKALGRSYRYVDVPETAAFEAMRGMGTPLWLVDAMLELHAIVKHGYAAFLGDGVQMVLRRPPTTLAKYIERLASSAA